MLHFVCLCVWLCSWPGIGGHSSLKTAGQDFCCFISSGTSWLLWVGFVLIVQYPVSQNSLSSGGANCFAVVFLGAGGEGQSLQEGEAEREEEAGRGRFDL